MSQRETPAGRRWSRRRFLGASSAIALGAAIPRNTLHLPSAFADPAQRKKRIAIVCTEVRFMSHAQHFIDRYLEGYGWQGQHRKPRFDLVSLYVDQFPKGDFARERSSRHGVPIYPTIAEALTRGGPKLDVDAVLIIGEHGKYPRNRKGQTRYPRYDFFRQVVKVFEESGRSVPVFNDKHLSTSWEECVEMVRLSREMDFPFLAGSSLPVTWRIPSIDLPHGTPLEESVCVCYGGVDSYDIHGLETSQCMAERRKGGEVGVGAVHALRGEAVWAKLEERPRTVELVEAALGRSHSLAPPEGLSIARPSLDWAKRVEPIAYFIDHLDGHRTVLLLLSGLISDFNYAGRVQGTDRIISTQMYLPMPMRNTTLASFFTPQIENISRMLETGKAPYPVERTLLTSGMVILGVESLYRGQVKLESPELSIAYEAPEESTYWRA